MTCKNVTVKKSQSQTVAESAYDALGCDLYANPGLAQAAALATGAFIFRASQFHPMGWLCRTFREGTSACYSFFLFNQTVTAVTELCCASSLIPGNSDIDLAPGGKSRLWESAQGDKWSFCLTAGKIGPRIRREHEQETAPEPCIGL